MSISKIISVLLIQAAIIFSLYAQDNQSDRFKNSTPEERAQRQTERMKTELHLDSATETKVHSINLKYAKLNQAIMNSSDTRMGKFQKFKKNSSLKDEELKNVFTKSQYEKYESDKEEMRKDRRHS